MLKRFLKLDLPAGQTLFLWGARQAGKSTYLKQTYPKSVWIDLLKSDTYLRYNKRPYLMREELLAKNPKLLSQPVIIDEVQKIPELLDEIHWLIENGPPGSSFILCGSSFRKLKHEGSNLLGGRAWRQIFTPLCYPEFPNFDLKRILNHGLLPSHYLSEQLPHRSLSSYLADYLIPEIQWESRIRHLSAFGRFLEAIAFSSGEILNSSNIAREAGVSVKTIQAYVELLVDMLIGYLVLPFARRKSRQTLVRAPKFNFFDPGIVRALKGKEVFHQLRGDDVGHAFEHYCFLELMAYKELTQAPFDITYWRTKSGKEVDFILGRVAIEVKLSSSISKHDVSGLLAFAAEHQTEKSIVVCLEPQRRLVQTNGGPIHILPIEEFLSDLWSGKLEAFFK